MGGARNRIDRPARAFVGAWLLALGAGSTGALGAPQEELNPGRAIELAEQGRQILWLRTGAVDVTTVENALNGDVFAPGRHVLMLDGPLDTSRRRLLEGAGVTVGDYLPLNACIADVSGATPTDLFKLGFVVWAGAYEDAWRLDAGLLKPDGRAWSAPERQALRNQGERFIAIWHFAGASAKGTLTHLSQQKGTVVHWQETVAGGDVVWVTLPQEAVAGLASLEDVQFVEEVGEFTTRSTSTTRWVVQSNTLDQTPFYSMGLTGMGELIGVLDDPVGIDHCALRDPVNPIGPNHRKIEAYTGTPVYSRHGTMVSGILLGDGGANDDTRGIAYGARMTFGGLPFLTEPSVTSLFSQQYSLGVRLTNNSWGDDGTTAYNGVCRALDALCFQNDDQLMVFAISNAPTIRNPENAKSVLAVGNAFNAPAQENICGGGVGLTSDNRIKPEIMAPGCMISAAAGATGCTTQTDSGTSFAAPAVTGVAALARQYFREGFYPAGVASPAVLAPSGALLKATLLNSSQDMSAPMGYPSASEGWGRVLLARALKTPGGLRETVVRDRRNAVGLATGETGETFIAVRDSSGELRVTLAFFDAPAAVNAALAPVNNLDLEAIAPDGTMYRGNRLVGGFSVSGGSADAINSVEQVRLATPMPGRWRVRVVASAVNQGPQGFAIVSSGPVADVPCPADLDDGSGSNQPDGGVDINDLLYFLAAFEEGVPSVDLDDGSGLTRPDGGVDVNDLLHFLVRFEQGC